MAIKFNLNDNARKAESSIWIFYGRNVVWLVVGCAVSLLVFKRLSAAGVETIPSLVIGALPLLTAVAVVHFLINGKQPRYLSDLVLWIILRFQMLIYPLGFLRFCPELWIKGKTPKHPCN